LLTSKKAVFRRMLRPLTARENELLQEVQTNPVSNHESPSTSHSDTDYSDYDDECEDKDPSIALAVPNPIHESKEPSLEEVTRLWSHAMQYRILCKIKCFRRSNTHHFAEYYEDMPFMSRDSGVTSRHLSGHIPVPSLKRYISATKERASFLVVRAYECKNPRLHAPRHRETAFPRLTMMTKDKGKYEESLSIISRSLEKAIRSIAMHDPEDPEDHVVDLPDERRPGSLVFKPPYCFVYHHRSLLLAYAQTCRSSIRSQISALLDYVEGTCGVRYRQVDNLFRHGKTTRRSFEFLFFPGDMLLSCTQGTYNAHTLSSWPRVKHDRSLDCWKELDCWRWTFDGLQFRRSSDTIQLNKPRYVDGAIPIQQLSVYPIKYAPQDILSHLKSRGQKFWSLRFQHYVSYTGWDVRKGENHVRYFLIRNLDS
jgi:hypothetical protein